ncbi:MAG: hypothetical protein Q8O01_04490 [Candidatus Omnitrophota bacterium]|nr:hypothetical protein [Candidatus Omnitrophota bacterium]
MITARSNGILIKKKPFSAKSGSAMSCLELGKGGKVLVCLVTLMAFLFNMVSYDLALLRPLGFVGQAWAVGASSGLPGGGSDRASGSSSFKEVRVETFALPEYLGYVKDSWSSGVDRRPETRDRRPETVDHRPSTIDHRQPVVIHIQDAHCNYAAQRRISEILEYLNKEYGIDTINLEGGTKDYDLSIFTGIYDKTIREKTADRFVREGLVNGAEYFAINNPEKITLWGVEDTKLYLDNLNVYRDSLKYKDEVDKHLNALTHILTNLKVKIYSPELLELDTKYSQYKAGTLEFKDYLAYLIQAAKNRAIDIKAFTNIYLLSQALKGEGDIDFKKANNQRDDLINRLQKKLSKKSLEELVAKTVGFRSGKISQGDFYSYLTKKSNLVGIELNNSPDFKKYTVYISMYNAIDKMKIMDEINKLENAIKDALYQNDKQKELNKLSMNLAILKNIFNISLTREDYKYYINNERSFNASNYVSFINKETPLYKITAQLDRNITDLDRHRENISKFYEYSFKRDDVFLRNIKFARSVITSPATEGGGRSNLKNAAILITGGFHTENLCEMLKKQNIAYISIMPTFSNSDGYN